MNFIYTYQNKKWGWSMYYKKNQFEIYKYMGWWQWLLKKILVVCIVFERWKHWYNYSKLKGNNHLAVVSRFGRSNAQYWTKILKNVDFGSCHRDQNQFFFWKKISNKLFENAFFHILAQYNIGMSKRNIATM